MSGLDCQDRLCKFLAGIGEDHQGRKLQDILQWSDADLEDSHDFIQWIFPNPGQSELNPEAPQLTSFELSALASHPDVASGARLAWVRFLQFLGLQVITAPLEVLPTENLEQRAEDWLLVPTHNDLRITRMLCSLTWMGLAPEARVTLTCLERLILCHRSYAPHRVLAYWRDAITSQR